MPQVTGDVVNVCLGGRSHRDELQVSIQQALVDMEKMFMLIAKDPEIQDKEDAIDVVLNQGEIEFKNLGFRHYIPLE